MGELNETNAIEDEGEEGYAPAQAGEETPLPDEAAENTEVTPANASEETSRDASEATDAMANSEDSSLPEANAADTEDAPVSGVEAGSTEESVEPDTLPEPEAVTNSALSGESVSDPPGEPMDGGTPPGGIGEAPAGGMSEMPPDNTGGTCGPSESVPAESNACVARADAAPDNHNVLTPTYQLTDAHWLTTPVRCGDSVGLRAVVLGYPTTTPAQIEVLYGATIVDGINAQIFGGVINATWQAKAPSAAWRTDRLRFRVRAASLSVNGLSDNELAFTMRPTTGWHFTSVDLPTGGGFDHVIQLYDQSLEAAQVHISVKIKAAGVALSAADQTSIKDTIQDVWNTGFNSRYKFHRSNCQRGDNCSDTYDCCKLKFRLDVNFVSTDEHLTIEFVNQPAPPAPRLRSGTSRGGSQWYIPPVNAISTYAHELGHILGNFDEYAGGANDTTSEQPSASPATSNLMSHSGNTTLLPRHFRWFLRRLNVDAGGDPYVILDTVAKTHYVAP